MAKDGPRPRVRTEDVLEAIREGSDPFYTTPEVAEMCDASTPTVRKRLNTLEEEGQVEYKDTGSARSWYVPDGTNSDEPQVATDAAYSPSELSGAAGKLIETATDMREKQVELEEQINQTIRDSESGDVMNEIEGLRDDVQSLRRERDAYQRVVRKQRRLWLLFAPPVAFIVFPIFMAILQRFVVDPIFGPVFTNAQFEFLMMVGIALVPLALVVELGYRAYRSASERFGEGD